MFRWIAWISFGLVLAACAGPTLPLTYPNSPREAVVDTYFGVKVADPYRWLEDLDGGRTAQWVRAQNAVSLPFLEALPKRKHLIERFGALWSYARYSPPQKRGGRYFYMYDDGEADHARLFVTDRLDGDAQVLIDPNLFSEDKTASLNRYDVSPDGKKIAYAISEGGSDWRTWRVRDVDTGKDTGDVIGFTKFTDVSWTADSAGFYYSRYPAGKDGTGDGSKPVAVYHHTLGQAQDADRHVFQVKDHPTRNAYGTVTDDGRFLVIAIHEGYDANDIHYRRLDDEGPIVPLLDKWDARYDLIGNVGDKLVFETTKDAPKGRVIAIDVGADNASSEVVPEAAEALEDASMVGGKVVAHYVEDAASAVAIVDVKTGERTDVTLPGLGSVWGFGGHADDTETFFAYDSYIVPRAVYRLDVESGETTRWQAATVASDLSPYVMEQVFVPSTGGVKVPMFVLRRKDARADGTHRTILYGYGGFNVSLLPGYRTRWIAWLELGGMVAIANLRGGGEYGEPWHQAGTKTRKQNVFDDFHACARWLVDRGWTTKERLASLGFSNGGLLVAATMTQKPTLYGATSPGVGVLDMLRYHTASANARGWSSDYGLSEVEEQFAALHAYSPVHNATAQCYPPTLITTADHDDRVVPWHSFKFAAALQHAQTCDHPVLLSVETRAGHGAGKPKWMRIEEAANRWAFFWWALD